MDYEIDINKLAQQRYKDIKEKGEFIELRILIGVEKEHYKEKTGRMPIVQMEMSKIGHEEIACMYSTLQSVISEMEEKYPMECLLASLCMRNHDIGSSIITKKRKKEEG